MPSIVWWHENLCTFHWSICQSMRPSKIDLVNSVVERVKKFKHSLRCRNGRKIELEAVNQEIAAYQGKNHDGILFSIHLFFLSLVHFIRLMFQITEYIKTISRPAWVSLPRSASRSLYQLCRISGSFVVFMSSFECFQSIWIWPLKLVKKYV